MKTEKLTLVLASVFILGACSIANATPDKEKDLNIYVYQDCQPIDTIAMDEQQIAAYQALKNHELKMTKLEQPLQQMEKQLASHERELEQLSEQLMLEYDDKIVINKAIVEQHKHIANKIKQVVASHQADINKLESEADSIKHLAEQFQQTIEPSLALYQGKNIQVQIASATQYWDCKT